MKHPLSIANMFLKKYIDLLINYLSSAVKSVVQRNWRLTFRIVFVLIISKCEKNKVHKNLSFRRSIFE
jgi:hypothetical protein